ncbi:sulfurtransferase TusA family protein [Acetobacter fabarum]|uniref:sulfurtransferase TusA family protein n=1 Tax=Acetobacter fabarum TaxID=483199 RepID=UPI00312B9865
MNETLIPEQEEAASAVVLDITEEKCPMTFVRTRLALDGLPSGGLLVVRLVGEEPHRNVSRSVRALGHIILADTPQPDGSVVLTIRKKEAASASA